MSFLQVDFSSEESILLAFDRIAEKFAKDIQLKVNGALYRIVDFEFYVSSKNFLDPHTHKHPLQLQTGKLYLHASGVDVTFGNADNYGGILLRGITKLHDETNNYDSFIQIQTIGPQNVATELFSNFQLLDSNISNEISIINIANCNEVLKLSTEKVFLKTKRVGLTYKKDDPINEYIQAGYRYLVLLPTGNSFKQKIPGIETIVKEMLVTNELQQEDAQKILGYTLRKQFC